MLLLLIVLPLGAALTAWFIGNDGMRRALLLLVAACELLLTINCWISPPADIGGELLSLDAMGLLVLTLTVILFFASSVYAISYFRDERLGERRDHIQGLSFFNAPESTFTSCMLIFLGSAVLVASTKHFGLLWVGIETTTLASAPLIYFHRHKRSLEATWKYLIICSVGMALAMVGNILLDVSMQTKPFVAVHMTLASLLANANNVHPDWFKAAFIFLFIGYGTKMGIAPMHTWLPDTYSEAPSISTVLSGALLNCAFLGIFRVWQVSLAAGLGDFSSSLLIGFGLLSMLTAALFIVKQGDFRRMLAYSSVEHMGLLLLGLGIGYTAAKGSVAHMVNHSLVKAALFLLAGKIVAKYASRSSYDITGMCKVSPVGSRLWLAGVIALVGAPPFALFWSEFFVLQGILQRGLLWVGIAYLLILGTIFVGMMTPVLHMYRGMPPPGREKQPESLIALAPVGALLLCVLVLGVYMPGWLGEALEMAASLGKR